MAQVVTLAAPLAVTVHRSNCGVFALRKPKRESNSKAWARSPDLRVPRRREIGAAPGEKQDNVQCLRG